ncbi:MAG: SsrA-binding protein SmpB [Candidatus Saccharimonadales bacterium]|nr:SsrA-binding protein SmpB [Candidatus Saccharimonadales bacterium]
MTASKFSRIIARNKRAAHDYHITKRVVAGVALFGHEVKSVRDGNVSLKNSYASIKNHELWLNNVHIGAYSKATLKSYEPTRARKLLVHKRELDELMAAKTSGLTIVVLAIGTIGRFLKVELGLGRGKKKYDKRHELKKRDQQRDITRRMRTK